MENVTLSKRFDLKKKEMQMLWLNQRIDEHFRIEPFFNESLQMYLTKKNNQNGF
jgi:hypothetical protein